MNNYHKAITDALYQTERAIIDIDRVFNIFSNEYSKLSKRLELARTTLKLVNDDLRADAIAEGLYHDEKEKQMKEEKKIEYMEQNEIQRMKWGEHGIDPNYEQARNDIETIADDVLRAVKGE